MSVKISFQTWSGCHVDAKGCACCVDVSFDEADSDKGSSSRGDVKHAAKPDNEQRATTVEVHPSTTQSRQTGDELGDEMLVLEMPFSTQKIVEAVQ